VRDVVSRTHLRLVVNRRPLLTVRQLVLFATPRSWPDILALDPTMTRGEWLEAILDADCDERGLGLLNWTPATANSRGTWSLTDKGRAHVARRRPTTKETTMGDFRIEVNAIGGHGCQRNVKDGETVFGCGAMNCPDCLTAEYIAKLQRSGAHVKDATLTHWPGQASEVKDEFVVSPAATRNTSARVRRGSFS
jgi:hypothetical protein